MLHIHDGTFVTVATTWEPAQLLDVIGYGGGREWGKTIVVVGYYDLIRGEEQKVRIEA